MANPARSDFTSGGAADAWWETRASGVRYLCATSGNTFVRLLQDYLRNHVTAGRSYDGTQVNPASIASDANWGPATQRALWLALQQAGAPSVITDAVAAEGRLPSQRGRNLGYGSVAAAIWLFHRDGFGPVPAGVPGDNIALPADVVTPQWLTVPAVTEVPPTGIFCTAEGVESVPEGQSPPAETAPGEPPPAQPAPVAPPPGVPAPPNVTLPLPPGILVQTQARAADSSVSWPLIVGVVVGVGLIAVVATMTVRAGQAKAEPKTETGKK